MWNYEKAKILAQTWVELISSGEAMVIDENVLTKSYGWIFFWQSRSFIKTQNINEQLAGNCPILIDRFDGELKVIGTDYDVTTYLEDYEKNIAPARLLMKPEYPSNK